MDNPKTSKDNEPQSTTPDDPTAEDPFTAGAGDMRDPLKLSDLLSDREEEWRDEVKESDPEGRNGPTYEVGQGQSDEHRGSTDR